MSPFCPYCKRKFLPISLSIGAIVLATVPEFGHPSKDLSANAVPSTNEWFPDGQSTAKEPAVCA
jgi:hypothetical protein